MSKTSELANIWTTIKEVDLRPLRQQALRSIQITIVGGPGSGRRTLAEKMRRDPSRPEMKSDSPLEILDLDSTSQAAEADLILLVIDERKPDNAREQALVLGWANAGKRVLVLVNQVASDHGSQTVETFPRSRGRRVVTGSILDEEFLHKQFAPAVVDLVPDLLIGLGRSFPLFRVSTAHYMINDACLSNAAYSLTTGLAEIVPVFDVPLNVADMVVLSKNQAFLAYKLGLALGYSTRWQDYLSEFGGVLGGGFLWRQLARSLVGLIPVWGILPKVAVAYAGTFVVGNAVLQWYLTGRHLSASQMRELYVQAFARGKNAARRLLSRRTGEKKGWLRLPGRRQKKLPEPSETQKCPDCGRSSAADASFCQYCGHLLAGEGPGVQITGG